MHMYVWDIIRKKLVNRYYRKWLYIFQVSMRVISFLLRNNLPIIGEIAVIILLYLITLHKRRATVINIIGSNIFCKSKSGLVSQSSTAWLNEKNKTANIEVDLCNLPFGLRINPSKRSRYNSHPTLFCSMSVRLCTRLRKVPESIAPCV